MRKITFRVPSQLETFAHTSSEIAKAAFVRGNASGCHGKNMRKQNRIKNRQEERNCRLGEFS